MASVRHYLIAMRQWRTHLRTLRKAARCNIVADLSAIVYTDLDTSPPQHRFALRRNQRRWMSAYMHCSGLPFNTPHDQEHNSGSLATSSAKR